MTSSRLVVAALALTSGTALAQPGATPPVVPPADAPPVQGAMAASVGGPDIDLDALIARARESSPTLEKLARGAIRRARRSVAIGPTVGAWGAFIPAQSDGESAITFGLGFEKFDVPVLPSIDNLKELVVERVKAKLKEQLIARLKGQPADPMVLDQIAREAWEEAVQEITGVEATRNRHFEVPSLTFGLEINHMFTSTAWAPRLRLGFGFSRVTLAATAAWGIGADGYDKSPVYLGAEIVGHYLTSKSPRSPVVDLFLRAEFETRNRSTNTDQMQLGVRFLLDVI